MTSGDPQSVRQAMEQAVGAAGVSVDVAGHSIDGVAPSVVAFPSSTEDLSKALACAWGAGMAVAPWGGGTRADVGNPIERLDVVVDLSRLDRVVQHNREDLTATVEAGITLARLQSILREQGQFLPLDPPLPDRATLGGTLASAVSGPLKWHFGHLRDLVIGMRLVQADGTAVKSGGQVVKNVSGYDMAKLHIGALGTLGVIAEVSLKLTPLPQDEVTLVASYESSGRCVGAGLSIFDSHVLPLALASFDAAVNERAAVTGLEGRNFLAARLGGRPLSLQRMVSECTSLMRQGGAIAVETLERADADVTWRGIADFGWSHGTTPLMSARATLLPAGAAGLTQALEASGSTGGIDPAVVSHLGYGTTLINWFADGGLSGDGLAGALQKAREAVHKEGGHMAIERCPPDLKSRIDVWDHVGEPLAIMRRLKEQYDPRGILNPGRLARGMP